MNLFLRMCVSFVLVFLVAGNISAQDKKVVFVPGPDSHGFGAHAHVAGVKLLADHINKHVSGMAATVLEPGWPSDMSVFDGAAAVVVFSDGGDGSMLARNPKDVEKLVEKGIGFGVLHYALDVPKGEPGDALLKAIGGYYEQFWSVNPWYVAEFKEFPNHPVSRGLKPFTINDEWYYHMRFAEPGDTSELTKILACVPPDSTRTGADGPHSGNPTVRENKGRSECVCWVFERNTKASGKGRGFGLTGAHDHWNWGHPMFLKTILNAIVWTAGEEVPESGIVTPTPTLDELLSYISTPGELTPEQKQQIQRNLDEWKRN